MNDRTAVTGGSTAIYNGTLLTMDASFHQYDQGLLITEDSMITYAGPFRQELFSGIAPEQRIDAEGGLIIPGLINTHTHLGMSLFRSLADDTADRLRKVLIPMEKALVNPQLVYYASLHSISEMLLGGTTTCADMYFFADQSARALQESGMRAVVGSSLSSAAGPDAAEFSEGLERLRELMQACEHSDLTTAAAAPHAPTPWRGRTCSQSPVSQQITGSRYSATWQRCPSKSPIRSSATGCARSPSMTPAV